MKKKLIEKRRFSDENSCKVYVQELSKKYPHRIISIGWIVFGEGAIYEFDFMPRFGSTEGIKNFQTYAYHNGIKVTVRNYTERLAKLEHKEQEAGYCADR